MENVFSKCHYSCPAYLADKGQNNRKNCKETPHLLRYGL